MATVNLHAYKDKDLTTLLELIIDRLTLAEVVARLEQIACDKAEHVRENWQDKHLAKTWDRDAAMLERLISKINN